MSFGGNDSTDTAWETILCPNFRCSKAAKSIAACAFAPVLPFAWHDGKSFRMSCSLMAPFVSTGQT
jgi:hypothetical protein